MSDSILHPLDFQIPTGPGSEAIPLARALKNLLPDFSWGQVRELCTTGKVTVDGDPVHDARRPVEPGMRVVVTPNAPAVPEPEAMPRGPIQILFEDSQVVVIDKPSGLSTVPFEEGERNTVLDYVRRTWRALGTTDPRTPLMVVHRLDKDTSGVLVLAKTEPARAILASQFRSHVVEREYQAVVHGELEGPKRTYHSFISSDRGDGLRGSVRPPAMGKEAITHVEVVQSLRGATLVRCRLETGRTHQVRIHLSEAGHPILGETVYIRDYDGKKLPFERLALHAVKLGFKHPRTGRMVRFEVPLPEELKDLVRELGGAPDRSEVKRAAAEAKANKQHWAQDVRDWWKEGPETGPSTTSRDETRERSPRSQGKPAQRPGTGGKEQARGGKRRKEPTGWLEGGPEAPPMGRRPERGGSRVARSGEAAGPKRGERSASGERPLSASRGRRAQAIEQTREGRGGARRGEGGEEQSIERAETRSSRSARRPLGAAEVSPRKDGERKPSREGERRSAGAGERRPPREGERRPGREGERRQLREDERKPARADEHRPTREGERRPARADERRPTREGERRPARDGERRHVREDERTPTRAGEPNPPRADERPQPPRSGSRRETSRQDRREGGDLRGPHREGTRPERRERPQESSERWEAGPIERTEGQQGADSGAPPKPRRSGFAGRGELRRGFRRGEESDDAQSGHPSLETEGGPRDAGSPARVSGKSTARGGRAAPADRDAQREASATARQSGARKKIRLEEQDSTAVRKAREKQLDALQEEISGLIDNAMKRK